MFEYARCVYCLCTGDASAEMNCVFAQLLYLSAVRIIRNKYVEAESDLNSSLNVSERSGDKELNAY